MNCAYAQSFSSSILIMEVQKMFIPISVLDTFLKHVWSKIVVDYVSKEYRKEYFQFV